MNTGTCLRPSWTAIVWPSISGTIMERRDHVLMTFLAPFSFCASTFFIRWSSTKGPFFRLRGIAECSYRFLLPHTLFLPQVRLHRPAGRLCAAVRDHGLPLVLHGCLPLLLAAAARDEPLAWLVGLTGTPLPLAPRAHRAAPARALAPAAPQPVADRRPGGTAPRQ